MGWLIQVYNLTTRDRPAADKISGVIESYVDRLTVYPPDVVQHVLDRWPNEHDEWPSWYALQGALATELNLRRPALPRPQAEHRPIERRETRADLFASKAEWDAHQAALRDLRDHARPVFGGPGMRAALLRLGEAIEARNRPHADRMGWTT